LDSEQGPCEYDLYAAALHKTQLWGGCRRCRHRHPRRDTSPAVIARTRWRRSAPRHRRRL